MATQPMPEAVLSAEQEQIRSLLLLSETVQKFNSVLDFNALLEKISTEVKQFLGCVETAIWIRDPESNECYSDDGDRGAPTELLSHPAHRPDDKFQLDESDVPNNFDR